MPLFNESGLKQQVLSKSLSDSAQILIKEAADYATSRDHDIFLSHSYVDADLVLRLKRAIEQLGFSIYVDWIEDPHLDRHNVVPATADFIRKRIDSCSCLLYVSTTNSPNSKWMPWELGYSDGKKKGKTAILPILSSSTSTESYQGQEYLGLYYYIARGTIINTNNDTLWVHRDANTYVLFKNWLAGKLPIAH